MGVRLSRLNPECNHLMEIKEDKFTKFIPHHDSVKFNSESVIDLSISDFYIEQTSKTSNKNIR